MENGIYCISNFALFSLITANISFALTPNVHLFVFDKLFLSQFRAKIH